MPHETFKSVIDFLFIQIRQSGADGFQCQGIHLEAGGFIRVPVSAQVRAACSHLDNGNGCLDVFGHLAGEAEFRAHDIIDWGQRLPSLGTGFVFAAKAVGEEGFILCFLQSGVRREAFDILHLRI